MSVRTTAPTPIVSGAVTTGHAAAFGADGRTLVDGGAVGGSGITELTGDVTAGPGSGAQAATIAASAVTNTKLADMAQSTIKGRAAGAGTGAPSDLTATQATAVLDAVVGDSGAGGTKGLVPAPGAGDAAAGKFLRADATWAVPTTTVGLVFVIDGGGATITTGIKGDLSIPFACTITANTLLADQSGSIVIDIWKDAYANYPPTDADSITAAAPPTISTAVKSTDSTLTGWTTSISAGDTLRFNVDSVTTIERVTLVLTVTR